MKPVLELFETWEKRDDDANGKMRVSQYLMEEVFDKVENFSSKLNEDKERLSVLYET